MQNLFTSVGTIVEDGNMYWGMGSAALGMIDVRDIADCCVTLLMDNAHPGEIFTPTGPGACQAGVV